MSSALQLYDDTDSTLNPSLSFLAVQNGTPSTEQTLHLYNDKDSSLGADDANDVLVTALSGTAGSGLYSQEHALAANRWIEVRAVDVAGTGISVQTTPWTPIGKNASLALYPIPRDCARYLEVRVNVPAGAGSQAGDVLIRASDGAVVVTLGDGHYEGQQGVLAGVGDASVTQLMYGGVLAETGTPDADINVSTVGWIHEGLSHVKPTHKITTNGNDKNAAALASGESYGITLSLGASTTVKVTKGSKATAPLSPEDYEAVPDGEILLGYVERPYDATIEQNLMDQTSVRRGGFDLSYSASSLDVTVSGGLAICANRKIQMGVGVSFTLAASDDTWLWLLPDGQFDDTLTDEAPTARALALWKVTTDGSGVTAVVDLRTWSAPNLLTLAFVQRGTLAASDYTYGMLPFGGPWYFLPIGGVQMGVGSRGATSGSTVGDIEYLSDPSGPTWTTLFTSSGTVDLRPTIAYNAAANGTQAAFPEVTKLSGGTLLRWKVVSVPGTASTDLFGVMKVAQAGS